MHSIPVTILITISSKGKISFAIVHDILKNRDLTFYERNCASFL